MTQPRTAKRKPPLHLRGRQAVSPDISAAVREVVPVNRRLGFRVGEFARLCGVSYTTIWRHIRGKKIDTVVIGGVRLIPRAFAIQRGLINENDNA